jgi:hypothetical protein
MCRLTRRRTARASRPSTRSRERPEARFDCKGRVRGSLFAQFESRAGVHRAVRSDRKCSSPERDAIREPSRLDRRWNGTVLGRGRCSFESRLSAVVFSTALAQAELLAPVALAGQGDALLRRYPRSAGSCFVWKWCGGSNCTVIEGRPQSTGLPYGKEI